MINKKSFLSLALAAAIALPTVTAHATTQTQTVDGFNTETLDANVKVTGSVTNNKGTAPAGKIQVELPTAMAFTVDEAGNFKGANYIVKNQSAEPIRLSVSEFRETDKNGGINLKEADPSSFIRSSFNRSDVAMYLSGVVDGQDEYVDLSQVDPMVEEPILDVPASGSGTITLGGVAGTAKNDSAAESNGVSEEFTLVFKIKKK